MQAPIKSQWLLALCGILDATISIMYLILYDNGPLGPLTVLGFNGMVQLMTRLALAAGVCTIAAGILRTARGKSWLLVLNGLAFSAFGLIPIVWRGPLGFDRIALLLVVMAITIGILALAIARTLRHSVADEWFFGFAGAGSIGFALVFLGLANGWIQPERRLYHPSIFLWQCFYFGFSAFCMLGLALRLNRLVSSRSGPWEDLPPLGDPKPAH